MRIILDTGFLYAINDAGDKNHTRATALLRQLRPELPSLILPVPVLPEICYLLSSRLGHSAMRRFLNGMVVSDIELAELTRIDIQIACQCLAQYADAELDFVDASLVAISSRLDVVYIATFDRRDFSMVRPEHCDYFELLP